MIQEALQEEHKLQQKIKRRKLRF